MTAALDYTPTWEGRGSCYGRPDVMDPGTPGELEQAIAVCRGCPVLRECLNWVMSMPVHLTPDGVVAGLTVRDRERLALSGEPPRTCGDCGEVKPLWNFPLNSRVAAARRAQCRACVHVRNARAGRARRARGVAS